MKPKTQSLPPNASEYIRKHFKEDFLLEVKEVREIKEQLNYFVEINKDDFVHSLQFDEQGNLVYSTAEEAFPPDIHEEQALGDVPE